MTASNSLWRRLERLSGQAGVMIEWQTLLGPCFDRFARYLRPTDREATAILCADKCARGCSRRIVKHGKRDIAAVCPEGAHSIPLAPGDCIIQEIDTGKLLDELAEAIGINVQRQLLPGILMVFRLGTLFLAPGRPVPIIISLSGDPDIVAKAAASLLLSEDTPFVLFGLTQRACLPDTATQLRRRGAAFVALDDYLDGADAGFAPRFPLRDVIPGAPEASIPIEAIEGATVVARVADGRDFRWLVNGADKGIFYRQEKAIKAKILNILYDQIGIGWVPHKTFLQAAGWTRGEYFGSSTEPGRMQKQLTEIRKFLGVDILFRKREGVRFAEGVVKSRE